MVLELPVPRAPGWAALKPVSILFAAYELAFIKVGIYWMNHHHMVQVARKVDGRALLANLLLLFWLSLVPYIVRGIGETGVTRDTVVAFGAVMLMCATSYALLKRALIAADGPDSPVARATGRDAKGQVSLGAYAVAIAIYIAVSATWLIPARRFEKMA